MIKTIEIRKEIISLLNTIHPRVYYENAPNNAVYPYIVYALPNSLNNGGFEKFILDIDGWDDDSDTTELETLMHNIDQVLHMKSKIVNNLGFTIYRDSRLSIVDADVRINRRKYVYQIRTYEGG